MLSGKKILLGVTAGIAAYKTTYLTRLLIKAGAEVKVILTPAARDFVTPLTLATLSKNPVLWEYIDREDDRGVWNNHVELALWPDLMLIAPATSNTLSKMTSGASDNFLLGVYMSAKCPVYVAPAMDLDMYKHPATQQNLERLKAMGNIVIPAESGELASGLVGEGRMAEPEHIVAFLEKDLESKAPLRNKRILINAGPTHEPIDPVRFIGNHSTGKMGLALAEEALKLGAQVDFIVGPNALKIPEHPKLKYTAVTTAQQMLEACTKCFKEVDVAILSAAIADYRPADVAEQKIKKTEEQEGLQLRLVKNPDILYTLGQQKQSHQRLVGFALETENGVENALKKLHKKNCDLIVLNSPSAKGSGFGYDTNEVSLIGGPEDITPLSLKSKHKIAHEIFIHLLDHYL
jgi:phosphopantothenoylcysteine decarboxylase/phosphopantothenate--cysteine ligase